MYERCETIELKIGVVANLDKLKEPSCEEEKIRQEKKRKPKIEWRPNPETIIHDASDYSWTIVVTNPRACRKIEEDLGR